MLGEEDWIQIRVKQASSRINQAREKGFQYLKVCVEQESKFVPQNIYLVQEQLTNFLDIDEISLSILQKCGFDNFIPYQINSRNIGSCLFDVASVLLAGDERLSSELRIKTCIEMIQNQNLYENHPKMNSFMLCSPVYERACLDCASYRGWSSIWTLLALSNVIGKNINSIYPPMNGTADRVHNTLHFVIEPEVHSDYTLYIMWAKQSIHTKGIWTPNHFVPVMTGKITNCSLKKKEADRSDSRLKKQEADQDNIHLKKKSTDQSDRCLKEKDKSVFFLNFAKM